MEDGLILVTGSQGFIGSRFIELYPQKNIVHAPKRFEFDITKPAEVNALFKSFKFKAVVHFAAQTDIFEAEKERGNKEGETWMINVLGTKNLAEAASNYKNVQFIYVSTDKVFPGNVSHPGPYAEHYPVRENLETLTWYGYTKAVAESGVRRIYKNEAVIVRTSNPCRPSFSEKSDLLRDMISNYDQKSEVSYFDNQRISIAKTDDVCAAVEAILSKKIYGTFHVSSSNTATPHEIANYLLQKVRGLKSNLPAIPVEEYIVGHSEKDYLYPKLSGLDSKKTSESLKINFGTWTETVDALILQGLGGSK